MIVADVYIVEKHVVVVVVAARQPERADVDAGRFHVDPKVGEPLVLGHGRVGAHDDDAIVAILRPTRPQLLPVDLPPVTVGLGAGAQAGEVGAAGGRSEEHTSALQSLMRISYAVLCLKKKNTIDISHHYSIQLHNSSTWQSTEHILDTQLENK